MADRAEVTTSSTITSEANQVVSTQSFASIIIRSVTLVLMGIFAIFGNSLVVLVVVKYKKLRTSSANIFVCNLSIVGVVIGILILAVVPDVIADRNALGHTGCSAWGLAIVMFYLIENGTFTLVSISRYYLIAHPQTFNKLFSLRNCVAYCAATWIFGLLMAIGTVTGWTEIAYNPKSKSCSYSRLVGSSYHYFILFVAFGIPLVVSCVSYTLLYLAVRRSARRTRITPASTSAADRSGNGNRTTGIAAKAETSRKKDWKLSRILIITFLVYVACLGPYTVVNMVDFRGQLSDYVHVTVTWLLFSNVVMNPLVYGLMNKTFKDAYFALFRFNIHHNSTDPGDTRQSS